MAHGTEFTKKFLHVLQFTLRVKLVEGKPTTTLTGSAGLNSEFLRVTDIMAGDEWKQISLEKLEVFQVYKWLLDAGQRDALSLWVKKVLASAASADASKKGGGVKRAAASSSSGAAYSKAGLKKKQKTNTSAENKATLLDFFGS